MDRRRPPSLPAIERARQQWLIDLHQRRQPKRRQRDSMVAREDDGRYGWRSKVYCYREVAETSVAEGNVVGFDDTSFSDWEWMIDFPAECALYATLSVSTLWGENVPEFAKIIVEGGGQVASITPHALLLGANDSRVVWPDSVISNAREDTTVPMVSAFKVTEGLHRVEWYYSVEHENKVPALPVTYAHTVRAQILAWIVAVEDRNPDDGPTCFDEEDEGGGEG